MFVDTPERAGVGECEQCHRRDVERFRFHRPIVVADPWRGGVDKTLVLVEPLCEPCYDTAVKSSIDNDT